MFRAMTILVASNQAARTGKWRKLLSLTRFGYKNRKFGYPDYFIKTTIFEKSYREKVQT
jgi:hypothetical protein